MNDQGLGVVFQTAADWFNQMTFRLVVPEYYSPAQSAAIVNRDIMPVRTPALADNRVFQRLACRHMIDMFVTKIPFEFTEDKDVLRVFHIMDNWLMSVEPLVEARRPEVIRYASNVLQFRQVFYRKAFLRVLNIHPSWKDVYRGGADKVSAFTLLNAISSGFESLDPIRALEKPPITLPESLAEVQDRVNGADSKNPNVKNPGSITDDSGRVRYQTVA